MAASDSATLAVKRELDALVFAGHTGTVSANIDMINGNILKVRTVVAKVVFDGRRNKEQ